MRFLQPPEFLAGLPDVADPPFCFSCGVRRGHCQCIEGPLSQQAWLRLRHQPVHNWQQLCYLLGMPEPKRLKLARYMASHWSLLYAPVIGRKRIWRDADKQDGIEFPFTLQQLEAFMKADSESKLPPASAVGGWFSNED